MTFEETVNFLYTMLPMYQHIGEKAFKKDLTNTLQLVDKLENPHLGFPSIHIAGTNGKGSTAHMISAILQSKGLKVGLYTSPHYADFRERIKINGQYISQDAVIQFVKDIRVWIDEIQPSFFEITVVMAFWYFAQEQVEIAIIEVGMGGEFDSTNIISPLISVITNISYDHQAILGNSLSEIATAKAGIIKKQIPVVIGESHLETKDVFLQRAKELDAPIYFADHNIKAHSLESSFEHTTYAVHELGQEDISYYQVGLLGDYQSQNLQTVLQTIALLPGEFKPSESEVIKGLNNVTELSNFFGRWQVFNQTPLVICDSAHNENGIHHITQQFKKISYQKLHFIIGMVADKDHGKILELLPLDAQYYFTQPKVARGFSAEQLHHLARNYGLSGWWYTSVANAYETAFLSAAQEDFIFIGGSVFVVADFLQHIQFHQ